MIYIKQLHKKEWVKGIARPVAYIGVTPRDLCLSHGIEFNYLEGDWGLGEVEEALMQTRSERTFGLIRYPEAPKTDCTIILVDEKLDDVTDDVNEIMCDLELQSSDIVWLDLDRYRFTPCKLIREDDHGNRILVGKYDCYPDAFFQKEKLEEGGHKQTYSIEMSVPKPKGWTGSWVSQF